LAQRLPDADPHNCFIAGLLHDFGKVVVAQFMPMEFRRAIEMSIWNGTALHLAMREVIGVDHAAIGAMLVKKWRFAPELADTIGYQHQPERCDTDMMACVFAANQMSKQLNFDFGGARIAPELAATVALRLGGSLEVVLESLGDLTPLLNESKLFSVL
jgi:HD-like signal output (HDOD) protein